MAQTRCKISLHKIDFVQYNSNENRQISVFDNTLFYINLVCNVINLLSGAQCKNIFRKIICRSVSINFCFSTKLAKHISVQLVQFMVPKLGYVNCNTN